MYRPLGVNLIEIKKSIEPKKLFHNVNSEMLTNKKMFGDQCAYDCRDGLCDIWKQTPLSTINH